MLSELTKDNVIEYFKSSPFYTDSVNFRYEVEQLDDQNDGNAFFKIIKYFTHQSDEKGDVEKVVAVYYVLNGEIYQCPDLYSVAKFRLVDAACLGYL